MNKFNTNSRFLSISIIRLCSAKQISLFSVNENASTRLSTMLHYQDSRLNQRAYRRLSWYFNYLTRPSAVIYSQRKGEVAVVLSQSTIITRSICSNVIVAFRAINASRVSSFSLLQSWIWLNNNIEIISLTVSIHHI